MRRILCKAFPGDPAIALPGYRYFIDMVVRLRTVKREDLTENSVLPGAPARVTKVLKQVEAAGFDQVNLYFNVGLKPHRQVKDDMARFMAEVARAFWRGNPHAPTLATVSSQADPPRRHEGMKISLFVPSW